MAQAVGYWDDGVAFTEGPFVIVNANGWRIEVEVLGSRCPCMPDGSVYRMLEQERGRWQKTDRKTAADDCDWLNEQVRQGRIVRDGAIMIAKEYVFRAPGARKSS